MKNNIEYLDKISKILEIPYFYELKNYGILNKEEMEYILSKIYDDKIRIGGRVLIDSENNTIYSENDDGYWVKREYNSRGNCVYHQDSTGLIINNRYKSI